MKDRLLLEGAPHQLIEGVIISAYAIGADIAYIFLRAEYTLAAARLREAIAAAYAHHYLGENILGTSYNLAMHIHLSAGRYICGEETALLDALEGRRATPRNKPPFPQTSGLFGKPTVVNNVETVSNIPHIVTHGAEWFKSLSRSRGRRHEALWRQRQSQAPRALGTADGHYGARNIGGACRRHA